jgi:hypothetical protein
MKQNYWFKVKQFGYGAYPVTWQGWVTLLVFVVLLFTFGMIFPAGSFSFYISVITLLFVTLLIAKIMSNDIWKWRWHGK